MSKVRNIFSLFIASIAICATTPAHAGVMMEGFYNNVPSGYGNPWWWDHLAAQAQTFSQVGFSAVWIPPALKGASGGYSEGYDPFDDYDLGDKNQMGTIPTHYGSREDLERACAMLRANGIDIYEDVVDNHRNGDDGYYNFYYADAYGNVPGGRFGKGPNDFYPNVPLDPDIPDGSNVISFGRQLAPVNGGQTQIDGQTWVWDDYNLKQAADWLTKALDCEGYRLDYVRGISYAWLPSFLNYGAMNGKFAVSENWDDNVGDLDYWVQSDMGGRSHAFDFPLHDNYLVPMCNNPGSFNMASLDHAGLTGTDPTQAVTFVENHDTDGSNPITQNKLMAYAYILTSEGYPCVFYRDWSTDPGCYGSGMQAGIDNLIWIHEKLASGTTQQRWKNNQIFVYERMGAQHLLTGLNDDTSNAHTITCATGFGAYVDLHDFTGHEPDVWTDGSGNATITIPVNNGGAGYVCYAPAGNYGALTPNAYATTQEYAGAQDLDIKPADNTQQVTVARVYAAPGQTIGGSLYYDTTSWTPSTSIQVEVDDPTGAPINTGTYTNSTSQGTSTNATASMNGFYTWKIASFNTPSANAKPDYWLKISYTAPKTFPQAPTLSGVSPATLPAGSPDTTITITGTNLDPTSTVSCNGNALATAYVSPTTLTADLPAADIASTGTDAITVSTPSPGGGTSAAQNITVQAANVTSSLTITRSGIVPILPGPAGGYQILTAKNTGSTSISGPIELALTGLPSGVTVTNSAGTFNGSPYVTATAGSLAPGASAQVRVNYSNPSNQHFTYGITAYSGAL